MMNSESPIDEQRNIAYSTIFCVFVILEITFFGMAVYFSRTLTHKSVFLVHGATLLLGNFFLLQGIITKNFVQICTYPILYCYTLTITFLNSSSELGLYFAFKMAHTGVLVLRGLVLCYAFNRLRLEFSWYSFKKLGPSSRVNGKSIF